MKTNKNKKKIKIFQIFIRVEGWGDAPHLPPPSLPLPALPRQVNIVIFFTIIIIIISMTIIIIIESHLPQWVGTGCKCAPRTLHLPPSSSASGAHNFKGDADADHHNVNGAYDDYHSSRLLTIIQPISGNKLNFVFYHILVVSTKAKIIMTIVIWMESTGWIHYPLLFSPL